GRPSSPAADRLVLPCYEQRAWCSFCARLRSALARLRAFLAFVSRLLARLIFGSAARLRLSLLSFFCAALTALRVRWTLAWARLSSAPARSQTPASTRNSRDSSAWFPAGSVARTEKACSPSASLP